MARALKPATGAGAVPRGWGRGNYEASGSMVLDRDEWEIFKKSLSESGGLYDHAPFTIIVAYANNDMGTVVDTLKSVKITKFDGGGASQATPTPAP